MEKISSAEFHNLIQKKVAIQFSATWCGPCKTLTKTIDSNAEKLSVEFYKVDLDDNSDLASEFNIKSVPTILLFENGLETKRIIGLKSIEQLQEFTGS